jgi:hypothetical protein
MGTTTHVMKVVGEVRDRACLVIDDMISTGGTLAEGIRALFDAGARPRGSYRRAPRTSPTWRAGEAATRGNSHDFRDGYRQARRVGMVHLADRVRHSIDRGSNPARYADGSMNDLS